ncbi:hypothetical protein PM082_024540 [Marasmius tenuissimus]|nr:hypothetical protein PM082_024540 [Marasmius tenuissimus]
MFKRLHINFAKKGWRAINKRDEFPQMTRWLSRQENVAAFDHYIAHRQRERLKAQERKRKETGRKEREERGETSTEKEGTDMVPQESPSGQDRDSERQEPVKDTVSLAWELQEKRGMQLTKSCSATRMLLSIETLHNVPNFRKHLTAFLSLHQRTQLREIPFDTLDLYHTLKFTWKNHAGDDIQETVHCSPKRRDTVLSQHS